MTAKLFEISIPSISLASIGIGGVDWVDEPTHPHDYLGNWLWDDGGCILWDDGGVIAL